MKKILIIEDDKTLRENSALFLKMNGFETITACDGSEGIHLAIEHLPDIIICDIVMPKVNGYEVLKSLHNINATSLIPFIFLSGKSEKEDFRAGMQLGADDYLTKPFNYDELLQIIKLRLEKQEQLLRAAHEINRQQPNSASGETSPNIEFINSLNISKREIEVLELISKGFTNTEIAEKLFISPRTVDFHRSNLLVKTNSKNTAELITYAVKYRIIS
ncbi:MAG TPA: response regulator transcription factor [Bacteroidales bacterium]|nr:response regulator transcription factor [Bacteroidales bacterium]